MVGEVVNHEDPVNLRAHLLPALHAFKGREPVGNLFKGEAEPKRRGDHSQRILQVVIAGEGNP